MSKITRKKNILTRTITVKLPQSLYEDLQAFRQELKEYDDTMILDVNDLVVTALKRDLRLAREELQKLKNNPMKPDPIQQSTLTFASASIQNPVSPLQKPSVRPSLPQ
jgi:GTPase involved in cell partitioning and DNA repair